MSTPDSAMLSIRDLVTSLQTSQGVARPVDRVSFDVPANGKVAIVGESGCGKTMTALSVMRLVPPAARIESGQILFQRSDLLTLPEREMRRMRGRKIAMVFQEPTTSLNPVFKVGFQIVEGIRAHQSVSRRRAREMAVELLRRVEIGSPETRIDAYPHELSGGMQQRVMIAMAMSCGPALLIADEPTTALDVTIQAQMLDLLDRLRQESGTATLLITHDLGVVASFADSVVVMYAGQVVEIAPTRALFRSPAHPYTEALLQCIPTAAGAGVEGPRRLPTLEGRVPSLTSLPTGCRFQDRCSRVEERCRVEGPELESFEEERSVRCHRPWEHD